MKKILTTMLLLATVCASCFALSETAIILHHNGEVKIYDGPSHLQEALNDAQEEDVLYLSAGDYAGFTITKKIYVKGAGDKKTRINGDININIDEEDIEYSEPILEGLYAPDYYIRLYCNTTGLTIRKCQFGYFSVSSGTHEDVTIDRCHITGILYYKADLHKLSIVNSKLAEFQSYSTATRDDVTIYNSNIYCFKYAKYFRGSIYNSIIGFTCGSYDYFTTTKIVNTFMHYYGSGSYSYTLSISRDVTTENIYKNESTSTKLLETNGESNSYSTKSYLEENKYFGTDGTVVGAEGGSTPYTTSLSAPLVKSTELEVDNANKKLKVKIKMEGYVEPVDVPAYTEADDQTGPTIPTITLTEDK